MPPRPTILCGYPNLSQINLPKGSEDVSNCIFTFSSFVAPLYLMCPPLEATMVSRQLLKAELSLKVLAVSILTQPSLMGIERALRLESLSCMGGHRSSGTIFTLLFMTPPGPWMRGMV